VSEFVTDDNHKKCTFPTGAKRNDATGKGAYDDFSPLAMQRVAELLERGASIYGSLNYAKGMPMKRTLQSILRHTYQYLSGCRKEDHLSAIIFGSMVLIHTEEMIKRGVLPAELDDLPRYVVSPGKPDFKDQSNVVFLSDPGSVQTRIDY